MDKQVINRIRRNHIYIAETNKRAIMAYYLDQDALTDGDTEFLWVTIQSTLNFNTTYGTEGGILWVTI